MRLAGTWKQYSKKAMPQLMRITASSGQCPPRKYRRCPYQAKVMNRLEMVSKTTVFMRCPRCPS